MSQGQAGPPVQAAGGLAAEAPCGQRTGDLVGLAVQETASDQHATGRHQRGIPRGKRAVRGGKEVGEHQRRRRGVERGHVLHDRPHARGDAVARGVRAGRGDLAVDLEDAGGSVRARGRAGILIGDQLAALVDGGFQKFFRTPSGKKKPATAEELKALHDFEEDVREAIGKDSYYNEGLGTVSTFYLYDRVKDRDKGVPKRIWE